MATLHLDLRISGTVQGVRYRRCAVQEADRLGVTGYAMNLADGTVRIEAEGDREALDRFVAWCRKGPSRAVVERVEVLEGALVGYSSFETRR